MIGHGVVMSFVDLQSEDEKVRQASYNLVNVVLPQVAKAVFKAMCVVYIEERNYGNIKKQFGITHDKLPAITFNTRDRSNIPYPEEEPLFSDELVAYATKIVKGEI